MSRLARLALVAGGAGLMAPSLLAASDKKSDQEQEYIQVRKIALKDERVQEAFERANEKLNERILEIDPSLKPYLDKHAAAGTTGHEENRERPKAASTPAAERKTDSKKIAGTTHVVEKGETLSSIAARYKVTVAGLKKANHITDERKLQTGQKLIILATGASTAPAASASPSHAAKSASTEEEKHDEGFWDRLKNSF